MCAPTHYSLLKLLFFDYCKARQKKRFGLFLDIKLKNRLRKVIELKIHKDLAEYIESNLEKIKQNKLQ
jgi:hypothetical protein